MNFVPLTEKFVCDTMFTELQAPLSLFQYLSIFCEVTHAPKSEILIAFLFFFLKQVSMLNTFSVK